MEPKSGAQISTRAFLQSVIILFVLMMLAGLMTRLLPAGSYTRITIADRQVIDPQSFQPVEKPAYPAWRWFTAPVEVLWGPDAVIIITIIVFLLMVGVSFAVLDKTGILAAAVQRLVQAFGGRKYLLLLVISFFFMLLGAFFGIFEEVVPLVPVMVALSYSLGWDALVGLGMSILATNMGFSAAITNPFTIGVAQRLAGLPLFSGAWFRLPIFAMMYILLAIFLVRYARKIERNPEASLVYKEDRQGRARHEASLPDALLGGQAIPRRAIIWLFACLGLILTVLVVVPFLPALSDFSLPLVGLLFFIGGFGAGLLSGKPVGVTFKALGEGASGIAPAIPLILMASSVKYIVAEGRIMDTILHSASGLFTSASPFVAVLGIFFLTLVIEFFIGSGSAKAFLLMPIVLPLADLVGVTRQVTVTAYCFGDGFTNLAYPTNPVLLICLGLTIVSYPKWMKWTLPLSIGVLLVALFFMGLGVAIRLGPF